MSGSYIVFDYDFQIFNPASFHVRIATAADNTIKDAQATTATLTTITIFYYYTWFLLVV